VTAQHGVLLFEPEKIFQALLLGGVSVSNSAAVVSDELSLSDIPAPDEG
jgi:hypothetical protein